MTSASSERSRLALLRVFLPKGLSPVLPPDAIFLPAKTPGQNTMENYGLAVFTTLFLAAILGEVLAKLSPPWSLALLILALPLSILVIHAIIVFWIFLGTAAVRLGWLKEAQRDFAQHVGQTCLMTLLALGAVVWPLAWSQWLAWLWLGLLTLNLLAWAALCGWGPLMLFSAMHFLALFLGMKLNFVLGLAIFLAIPAFTLWGLLRANSSLFFPVRTSFVSRQSSIWLTIDDGPEPGPCEEMLALLRAHDCRASFFLIGQKAEQNPELTRRIAGEAHEIGNHTWSHAHSWFWALPPWRIRAEVTRAQQALSEMAEKPIRRFRGPVGFKNLFLPPALLRYRLEYLGWSARAYDGVAQDPEIAWGRLQRGLRPGAIVLLHQTALGVHLLGRLLQWMKAEGLVAHDPNPPKSPQDIQHRHEA